MLQRIAVRLACVPEPDNEAGFADLSIIWNGTRGAVRLCLVWHIACFSPCTTTAHQRPED